LSQPRFDAQGKPINPDSSPARQMTTAGKAGPPGTPPAPATTAAPPAEEKVETDPSKRKVRAVGPAFYPEH
jgi:hypothetical protein